MDLQKRVNLDLAWQRTYQRNPELPFTEIVRQGDDSLQQARLVMVWQVPGLNQLNLMSWMFWGDFGVHVKAGAELREERSVPKFLLAIWPSGYRGHFIFQPVENLETVEAATRNTYALSRQNRLQR